jgi:hypothetical protein
MKIPKRALWFLIAAAFVVARTAPAQGTLHVDGKDYKLQHVVVYETKFFDDKAISVLLCEKPIPIEKLKEELKKGSDDSFFIFEPEVKLTFDPSGKLLGIFLWADNNSISVGGTMDNAKIDASFNGGKAKGKVALAKGDGSSKYAFDVSFDAQVVK